MESGFIYLWYDRKHKRYYLGKHWGSPDDGYICSSTWMKRAWKRRSHDFKRRILEWIHTNREELSEAEHRWGKLISEEELGKKYYNLRLPTNKQWHDDEQKRTEVSQKISSGLKGRKFTDEHRQNISVANMKRKHWTVDANGRKNISEGLKKYIKTDEHKQSISESAKKRQKVSCVYCGKEAPPGQLSRWHNDNCKLR